VAQPLYEATKGSLDEPILTISSIAPNLVTLKKSLSRASSSHLLNPSKPFLFIHSNKGQALDILCQKAGDTHHPIAYLSKQLDPVFRGWPLCLHVLATVMTLILEANKPPLIVFSSHSLKDLHSH
jgi:hypothetical protein